MSVEEFDPDAPLKPSTFWAVHSEIEGRPALAEWSKSEQDAEKKARALKERLGPSSRTWVTRLTEGEVSGLKHSGFIPQDA